MFYKRGTAFSIVLLFIAVSMLGWLFVPLLSVRLQPSSHLSAFTISGRWGNNPPVIIEARVTSKLEGALNTLQGVKEIKSVSSMGKYRITLTPGKYADNQRLRLEIASLIRQLYPKLPKGVSYPIISLNSSENESQKPLLTYSLYGPTNSFVLQNYAIEHIKKKLAFIPGIDKIIVYGGTGFEWQMTYVPEMLNNLGISPGEIKNAIYNYFYRESVGFITETSGKVNKTTDVISVKFGNSPVSAIPWDSIPVKKTGSRILYLGSLTNIKKVQQKITSYFRIDGQNSVNIVVFPKNGSNALQLAKTISKKIKQLKTSLPPQYKIENTFNSTKYIKGELEKIYRRTLFTFLILLLFVFIVSFSIRYVLLIILSLFTNLSISFILYYFLGVEINIYSLAGITVSLGLIIDNSIVMADHLIYRKNMRIYTALLASTLTTIASLVIVFMLPDKLRLSLLDFASIIAVNLGVSLLVALFFIPAFLSLFPMKRADKPSGIRKRKLLLKLNKGYSIIVMFLLRYRTIAVIVLILTFGLPAYLLPGKINSDKFFPAFYNKTLGNEWYLENIRPVVNKVLGGSLRLFTYYVFENSYYTKPEETKLYVRAALPKGATVEQLNNVFKQMESLVMPYRDKINFYTRISGPRFGEMVVTFKKKWVYSSLPYLLKGILTSSSVDMGGVNWDIFGVGKGYQNSVGGSVRVNYKLALYGFNYNTLKDIAIEMKEKLQKHPRISNINISGNREWYAKENSYRYFIKLYREKLAFLKIPSVKILTFLKDYSPNGGNSFRLFVGNHFEQIRLLPDNTFLFDKWNVLNTPVYGIGYPLNELLSIHKEIEPDAIYKKNQNYIRVVQYDYTGSYKFGDKFLNKVLKQIRAELPLGYRIKKLTYNFSIQKASVSYTWLILIVIVIIFFLCSILFNSLKLPFAIIATIPASFIGVFLLFYFFDINFDQGGYASFLLISGLVVNASIYILYEFIQIQKQRPHLTVTQQYIKAFNHKIIPVLLTILSTIFGLVPFIINGQKEPFWFALAAGTMGGLLFSIFVLVVYFPLFIIKKSNK